MSKRKYPTDISQTSGAFYRAIQRGAKRRRSRGATIPRSVGRNVARRQAFPNRGNMPMPTTWITTHRYCQVVSLDPSQGVAAAWAFAANGLYDPDISGTGHQPMGFDQMTTFYNHYEVIGSKIRMFPHLTGEGAGFNYGIRLDDNGVLATSDFNGVLEGSNTNWKSYAGPYTSRQDGFEVINSFSRSRFFGEKSGDRETWGDVTSNPTDVAYYLVFLSPLTSLQNIGAVPITVTIEYIVKWHEPKDLGMS